MAKKTIQIEQVKRCVNSWLSSDAFSQEEKRGMGAVLETILHATDNYRGFEYLHINENAEGSWIVEDDTEYSRNYI